MLHLLLVVAFWAIVAEVVARRRSLRQDAEVLRRLTEADRERILAEHPDQELRHALRDDVALADQGGVARFHFAPGTRRLMARRARNAALGATAGPLIIIVSDAVSPLLNMLCGTAAACCIAVAAWRVHRLRRMDMTFEVSPFNLTEIGADGSRRVLPWRQPLVLRNRPSRRCVEVGPRGSKEVIRLDYHLLEFYRAVELVLHYGGFVEEPPAT